MQNSFEGIAKLLREKATNFGTQIELISKLNTEMRDKIDAFLNALQTVQGSIFIDTNTPKCTICYTRERTHTFLPCGHVVCRNCSQRASTRNPPRCFTCRQPIQETHRIFL